MIIKRIKIMKYDEKIEKLRRERDAKIADLKAKGLTFKEVARVLGISRQRVQYIWRTRIKKSKEG